MSPHPRQSVRVVGLDGDDTLWRNEEGFLRGRQVLHEVVSAHNHVPDLDARLLEVERRNLRLFGYGVKGFTLSLIETAIELTEGRAGGADVQRLLEAGRVMLEAPVELMEGVVEAAERLARAGFRLMLVTKGDLVHQEAKVAGSGLAGLFGAVEIISEKDEATYLRLLRRHGVAPEEFLMAGNSMRSDVLPVLAIGGWAAHVPHELTWAHEAVPAPDGLGDRLLRVRSLAELADLLS